MCVLRGLGEIFPNKRRCIVRRQKGPRKQDGYPYACLPVKLATAWRATNIAVLFEQAYSNALLASSLSDQKWYEKAHPLKVHFPKQQWALHRQKRSQKRGIEFHAIVLVAIQLLRDLPFKLVMPVTAFLQPYRNTISITCTPTVQAHGRNPTDLIQETSFCA